MPFRTFDTLNDRATRGRSVLYMSASIYDHLRGLLRRERTPFLSNLLVVLQIFADFVEAELSSSVRLYSSYRNKIRTGRIRTASSHGDTPDTSPRLS